MHVRVDQPEELTKSHKTSLQLVSVQEQSDIIRSMEILLENYKKSKEITTPKKLSKVFIKADIESQRER